jgi:hypothetical protein
MENTLIFAFGALIGVIIYRALVILRLASIGIGMFKLTELNCLQLLALTIEDASFVKETKHRIMERTNSFTDVQIEVTKIADEQLLKTWKEKSIKKLLSRYPQNLQGVARYSDWRTGMAWLNLNVEKVLDK